MLLFGVLLLLPLLAWPPVALAGTPPLVVVPLVPRLVLPGSVSVESPPPPIAPRVPVEPLPPVLGPPELSGAGATPLKPVLPPAGLSGATGVDTVREVVGAASLFLPQAARPSNTALASKAWAGREESELMR